MYMMLFATKKNVEWDAANMQLLLEHNAIHGRFKGFLDKNGVPIKELLDEAVGQNKTVGLAILKPGECEVDYVEQRASFDRAAAEGRVPDDPYDDMINDPGVSELKVIHDGVRAVNSGNVKLESDYIRPELSPSVEKRAFKNLKDKYPAMCTKRKYDAKNLDKHLKDKLETERVWTTGKTDTVPKTKVELLQQLLNGMSVYTVCR